ncbi:hypothetical protein, partial [Ralstonia solanacearum species complex bacterium KE055]|uniref:hypothetical protein n=1 Tax=Ralstonia solanacearum species complex bacterium KE055 TaxID=3119586 RepID=UPI002FC2BD8E
MSTRLEVGPGPVPPFKQDTPMRPKKTKGRDDAALRLLTNPTFFGVWGFVFYAKRILGRRQPNRPEGVEKWATSRR